MWWIVLGVVVGAIAKGVLGVQAGRTGGFARHGSLYWAWRGTRDDQSWSVWSTR